MAILKRAPYVVGDIGKLWPTDEASEWVEFTAPDGQQFRVKRNPPGAAKVWLLQAGEWTYEWTPEDSGSIDVLAQTEAPSEPVAPPARTEGQTRWM